jgi:hypothetical protein
MDRQDDESDDVYPEEYDGPRVRIPSVDVPEVEVSTSESDAITDSPIATLFALHVLIWNAVLLFFSLGVMLVYFEGNWNTGGQLIVVSIVLTLYGVYRWPDSGE